jgi:hypothetical protein
MPWYFYLLEFVSGLFLANGVPHFVQGVSGHRFQSPFASPPGVGESSPLSNALWGYANLAVGATLLWFFRPQGDSVLLGWILLTRHLADGCDAVDLFRKNTITIKFSHISTHESRWFWEVGRVGVRPSGRNRIPGAAHIPIDFVARTSMSGLTGRLYASGETIANGGSA